MFQGPIHSANPGCLKLSHLANAKAGGPFHLTADRFI